MKFVRVTNTGMIPPAYTSTIFMINADDIRSLKQVEAGTLITYCNGDADVVCEGIPQLLGSIRQGTLDPSTVAPVSIAGQGG